MDPELREALNQVVVDLRGEIQTLGTDLRGEIRSAEVGGREALNQLAVDLRGEIRSVDAGLRSLDADVRSVDAGLRGALNQVAVDLRGEIRSSATETRDYVDERIRASSTEMRRHFDVVGESLRGDIRAIAEGMVASREQTDRRIDEQAGRSDGLGRRVLRPEVRVTRLVADRKPRGPRRRR